VRNPRGSAHHQRREEVAEPRAARQAAASVRPAIPRNPTLAGDSAA
jgi:hypothetical protein